MSLKFEQYRSLKMTREFMWDLLDPQKRPKTVLELKKRAGNCLRHFPMLTEKGKPIFSRDNFDV
jgi:hypothetical protein